ncbi:MAG: tRNA epoxyqueuosine(34) reductase QueG [Proteobacteria bacterium]|nr:tRNA epoxyqueuosine(34) reductase QueG [Pseudomonadota bacterium]
MSEIKQAIRAEALTLGFDAVGFAAAEADPKDRAALNAFLAKGYAGGMDWLAREDGRRGDAKALMAEAKTAIVLGVNYGPDTDPLALLAAPDRGAISVYARGRDYHDVIKKRLKRLGRWLAERQGATVKVYVDTAPLMEKPLAQRAGLGWQGKHTNLVSRRFGSWLFLGEILTDLYLPPDAPEPDHCGSCDRCIRACPTDAFPAAYELDPRRCISYLTIEHKGDIAPELMDAMGSRIYGCDDCLAVCPWAKFATPSTSPELAAREELQSPRLAELASLDDQAFRKLFAASPVKRTGRDRFVRNVLIAVGNSKDPNLAAAARLLLDDPSPLVAAAAKRAVEKLAGG